MKSEEILRLVDTIHRSKEIEKEIIFQGIEACLLSAVHRKHGESEADTVVIDRETGETIVLQNGEEIDAEELGRLAAMSGKQVLFQKIREAERDKIFEEYEGKIGQLVPGVVQRNEGPNLIVSLGRVEGFLPRSEQAPGERFRVGERIKALVKDVQKSTNRVKITLSRTAHELVSALFALEIPEVQENAIEIKKIAREAGYRTKIAVTTTDTNIDCVGACVGVRGSRIKNVVDELFGEKIDIVRWNESDEVLIIQALKPAEISTMDLDDETMKATIYVKPDQQSLAIGKRGQNVRLASKLTGWELAIEPITDEELEQKRKEGAGEIEVDIEDEELGDETEATTGLPIEQEAAEEAGDGSKAEPQDETAEETEEPTGDDSEDDTQDDAEKTGDGDETAEETEEPTGDDSEDDTQDDAEETGDGDETAEETEEPTGDDSEDDAEETGDGDETAEETEEPTGDDSEDDTQDDAEKTGDGDETAEETDTEASKDGDSDEESAADIEESTEETES